MVCHHQCRETVPDRRPLWAFRLFRLLAVAQSDPRWNNSTRSCRRGTSACHVPIASSRLRCSASWQRRYRRSRCTGRSRPLSVGTPVPAPAAHSALSFVPFAIPFLSEYDICQSCDSIWVLLDQPFANAESDPQRYEQAQCVDHTDFPRFEFSIRLKAAQIRWCVFSDPFLPCRTIGRY